MTVSACPIMGPLSRHQHFLIATVLTLKRPVFPILIRPPKVKRVRGAESGQEPHFDQGQKKTIYLASRWDYYQLLATIHR